MNDIHMSLLDISRPKGITCTKYERAVKGKKACRHFIRDGGACSLPSEVMCVEYLKRNPKAAEGYHHPQLTQLRLDGSEERPAEKKGKASAHSTAQGEAERQAGGAAAERAATAASSHSIASEKHPEGAAVTAAQSSPGSTVRPSAASMLDQLVSESDVQSLIDSGQEFEVNGWGKNELTLVPERTNEDRIEITFRDAVSIANMMLPFPGARITAIRPSKPSRKAE